MSLRAREVCIKPVLRAVGPWRKRAQECLRQSWMLEEKAYGKVMSLCGGVKMDLTYLLGWKMIQYLQLYSLDI
jgi:hypothetical protein